MSIPGADWKSGCEDMAKRGVEKEGMEDHSLGISL